MNIVPNTQIEAWEEEGGAARRLDSNMTSLRGTENQVEWGLRIKLQVNEEFDRVAAAFTVVAHRQNGRRRTETETIIAILEEKRLEVMRNDEAGYFNEANKWRTSVLRFYRRTWQHCDHALCRTGIRKA
jgi:hypothetical protein